MFRPFKGHFRVASCLIVLAVAGCSQGITSPKVTVTKTTPDFHKMSVSEITDRIKKKLGDEFSDVALSPAGANKLAGTATMKDGEKIKLTVDLTPEQLSYKAEGENYSARGVDAQSGAAVKTTP